MGTLALIQPRHIYARPRSDGELGQIYFPTAAYVAASRFESVGYECRVYDENFAEWDGWGELVGIASIGSPYMEPIASRIAEVRSTCDAEILVGGQGVRGLTEYEFSSLFGSDTQRFSDDFLISRSVAQLGCPTGQEQVSIEAGISSLSDAMFAEYFSREAPLYVSQGCRYSCTFCGAERSRSSSAPGPQLKVRELYRNFEAIYKDLATIRERSQKLGIKENSFYLSNLDVFQSPGPLSNFLDVVENVLSAFGGGFVFRGLSTTNSFIKLAEADPDLIHRFVELGLVQIGFGIDGATPEVWKAIRKPHSSSDCLDAVALAREEFGIIPEALMVFGHEGHDNVKSLQLAVDTVKVLVDEFGAVPRPHVAKGLVPGNDGWYSDIYKDKREFLLRNSWAFQFLDFTCIPTDFTHDDAEFRREVTKAFLSICEMDGCLTRHVMPEDRRLAKAAWQDNADFNKGRFDI